jgi:hypothetical protein
MMGQILLLTDIEEIEYNVIAWFRLFSGLRRKFANSNPAAMYSGKAAPISSLVGSGATKTSCISGGNTQ